MASPLPFNPVTAPDELRLAARPFVAVESYIVQPTGEVVLRGRLLADPHAFYRPLRAAFEGIGFTPLVRRHPDGVEIVAQPGVIKHKPARVWINWLLFVLTVASVLANGAMMEGVNLAANPAGILRGLPFMLTVLGILGTHEMGHFIVGRWRGAPMSWPYFIPMPFTLTGTMGAVIVQREPLEDRRTLLEVGIAGPLAGLVVAIPLLFVGLSMSTVGAPPSGLYMQEGNSLVYALAKYSIFRQWLPGGGVDVQMSSVAFGAWIGLLITMLNLLPVGQLDGGHIAYALLGRKADYLGYAVIGLSVVLGIAVSQLWLVWAAMPLLTGLRHPAPFNDVPDLDRKHVALAISGLVVFVLLFVPNPLTTVGG